jgi:hypothetical protein
MSGDGTMMHWLTTQGDRLVAAFVENAAALTIDVVLTGLLIYPLCNFLRYGWTRKADEVKACMTAKAKQTYFNVFWDKKVTLEQAPASFWTLYSNSYGRDRFIPGIVAVFVVAAAENFHLGDSLAALVAANPDAAGVEAAWRTVPAAIAGAYMFVTWDFFARVQRRNLGVADILRGGLRLAMAVPIGASFSLLAPGAGVLLAFGIGVFPFETIATILRRLVNDKLKTQLGPGEEDGQIGKLDGVDRAISDRLADADITTIPQLAWCDPISIVMRTSLPFDYVVDIVSQALAWVYLGKKLEMLRLYGLRGAYEIHVMMDDLKKGDPQAVAVLPVIAKAVDMPVEGLTYALVQIAEDGATLFLYDASFYDHPEERDDEADPDDAIPVDTANPIAPVDVS